VNGRSRTVIFEDMRSRIQRADIDLERKQAIQVSQQVISYGLTLIKLVRLCVKSRKIASVSSLNENQNPPRYFMLPFLFRP
jgi:hypothetical protein